MVTKGRLETELKEAIRSGDPVKKRTLRTLLTAVKLAEVDKLGQLEESELLEVVQREAKSRRETIDDAERAGRQDLIRAAQADLAILEGYLPKPLSSEALEELARQVIAETGASGPGAMGLVMKALMPRLVGRAEGKAVSDVVRRLLSET